MSKPASIGSIVLYTVENSIVGPKAVPAIVTHENDDGSLRLTAFPPGAEPDPVAAMVMDLPSVEFTKARAGTAEAVGFWSWS